MLEQVFDWTVPIGNYSGAQRAFPENDTSFTENERESRRVQKFSEAKPIYSRSMYQTKEE